MKQSRKKPKLGQHFLKDENVKKRILDTVKNLKVKNIIEIDSKKIIVGLDNMKNLNEITSENIIRRIYQFLFYGSNAPRSKKIRILINEIKKLNFKYFNIRGMIVKKNDDFLTFSR